jgi:hypothetical protein
MKKASTNISAKDIRPEYDLATLKGGVRGKYYEQARTGSVLIAPELANVFPDTASVNRALRLLADTAEAVDAQDRRLGWSNCSLGGRGSGHKGDLDCTPWTSPCPLGS